MSQMPSFAKEFAHEMARQIYKEAVKPLLHSVWSAALTVIGFVTGSFQIVGEFFGAHPNEAYLWTATSFIAGVVAACIVRVLVAIFNIIRKKKVEKAVEEENVRRFRMMRIKSKRFMRDAYDSDHIDMTPTDVRMNHDLRDMFDIETIPPFDVNGGKLLTSEEFERWRLKGKVRSFLKSHEDIFSVLDS